MMNHTEVLKCEQWPKSENAWFIGTNLTKPITREASHSFQSSLTVVVNFPRNSMMII